ncbi:5777_t:CDS:2 [Dentiscutata erythropus]|uniref:5777_t:CDS:1 n=1 Tax=Dentiscutata erythropus TaxID=1348616 RepID=A0A9N9IX29_9GLOM|nr:5777_t:CDS:2 [Dentiscutata erythropus]
MSKSREVPAQSKLKNTIAQLTEKLWQLSILDQRGMITNIDKERKEKIQYEIRLSSKALHKLEYHKQSQQKPTGCPSLEEQQPDLLEAIVQIVSLDGQADERYTEEGKRHVKTVPVKLLRSQNTARRSHEDTHFCAALIRNIKEIVSLLGPKSALVISQDDKARIPLGLAAANKQAPILMRLEYRVELLDHDWVVAKKHKQIPSVYAILDIQESKYEQAKAVTYSGPIFIRIRSGKHDSSTTYSHSKDFDDLINEEKLRNYTTTNEQPKPVVVLISDGGPNENPKYRKTIQMMIEHFDKYSGVILPHDTFGLYLDAQLKTNDEELEKYPPNEHYSPSEKSATWIEKHVITCHYVTQVVKCDDPSCFQQTPYNICAAKINEFDDTTHFSSFLLSVLMERKLTPPDMNLRYLSFDWYCPTVNKSINEYICSYCNRYFALKKTLKNYTRKCLHKEFNLSVEAALDTQKFPVVYVHNYHHGEFLVSNKSSETIWVEEEVVPEDILEIYNQQVQVQEELVADKVLIVNWDT